MPPSPPTKTACVYKSADVMPPKCTDQLARSGSYTRASSVVFLRSDFHFIRTRYVQHCTYMNMSSLPYNSVDRPRTQNLLFPPHLTFSPPSGAATASTLVDWHFHFVCIFSFCKDKDATTGTTPKKPRETDQ